eukprot:3686683-Rhodomonas_salina.2
MSAASTFIISLGPPDAMYQDRGRHRNIAKDALTVPRMAQPWRRSISPHAVSVTGIVKAPFTIPVPGIVGP